jgi:membrane-bound serine protease (ClpP class)
LVLTASETAQEGYVIPSQPSGGDELIGRKGKAVTTLHPTGKMEVNNHTLDVVTDGEYIEKGQFVEIIEIRGNRIVVKAV